MCLTVRPCHDAAEWDDLARRVPWATPQHDFSWGRSLDSCFGYLSAAYRLFCSRDRALAGLPLIRFSAGPMFRAVYSLSFDSYGGPLIPPEHCEDAGLLSAISKTIDDEAFLLGAFEARFTLPPEAPDGIVRLISRGIEPGAVRRVCPLLALDRPLDQITNGFKPAIHRGIRRGIRQGIIIDENADIGRVRQAFPLYGATMRRVHGTAKPWRFIETLLREGLAVPFVARIDERAIGLVILLVSPRMAIYWISAADPAYSSCRPTIALVNRAIGWCHRRAIRVFSFGESPEERPGLLHFKESWGPELRESTTVARTYRFLTRRAWDLLEPVARRAYRTWDRWRNPAP